jgi:hypothetical protein
MFSFQFFVPFSLMIMFWFFLCWYMFKHVQTYTKARDFTRRMVFFFSCSIKAAGLWMFTGLCKVLSQF